MDKKTEKKDDWVPICRIAGAYDFDEKMGKYLDSQNTVELQQNPETKVIRAIVVK